ncbi:uncharacterized protein IL334_003415 [Kwoniella shivajii]|uniref:P-loop containing nucleoside triphosphate hydrolase protein n=1 Tax=Kwoniella shivajii TaxID=564305 RepID=A0ABZ1D0G9_9TREE|nr:hypothetical protein IL334_003415 [Kwoniella shivajii]
MDTEKMLTEIEGGTASELAMLIRYNTYPFGPTFIPSLDDLILEGRQHPGKSTLMRADLVEVIGGSGSGKSSFTNFLILSTVLPRTLPDLLSTPIEGRGMYVTLIQPITHRSIIPYLKKSMKCHLQQISPSTPGKMIDQVILDSLSRLRIYRTKPRYKECALCLKSLLSKSRPDSRGTMTSVDRNGINKGGLDLLVIEGMGDPHYPARWNEEQKGYNHYNRSMATTGGRKIIGADEIGLREIMDCVDKIRKELGTTVIMSTQGLRVSKESPFFHTHLPHPYPSPFSPPLTQQNQNDSNPVRSSDPAHWPLTIQITLTGRQRRLQYPIETTLVEVLQEKAKAMRNDNWNTVGTYEGAVRMIRGEGVVGTRAGGRFRFDIGDEGMRV